MHRSLLLRNMYVLFELSRCLGNLLARSVSFQKVVTKTKRKLERNKEKNLNGRYYTGSKK